MTQRAETGSAPSYTSVAGEWVTTCGELYRSASAAAVVRLAQWSRQSSASLAAAAVYGTLPSEARQLCVFAHYDPRGSVASYVLRHLEELRSAGFALVCVSNSEELSPPALEALESRCDLIIVRRNVGWDFGAYRHGILFVADRIGQLDSVLLVNDSTYGPLLPIKDVLSAQSPDVADVWGITDCWLHRYHLQSYYLLFHTRALRDSVFIRFWQEMPVMKYRHAIVRYLEVGLTQRLLRAGLRCRPLVAYSELVSEYLVKDDVNTCATVSQDLGGKGTLYAKACKDYRDRAIRQVLKGKPLNPTHWFWRELLEHGSPYIKRTLFRNNVTQNPDLKYWRPVIGAMSKYDVGLIEDDLS